MRKGVESRAQCSRASLIGLDELLWDKIASHLSLVEYAALIATCRYLIKLQHSVMLLSIVLMHDKLITSPQQQSTCQLKGCVLHSGQP